MTSQENTQMEQFDGIKESRTNKPPVYFNILFYGLILWGILFAGYFLFSGWSSHDEFQVKMNAHQEDVNRSLQSGGK